MRRQMLRRPRNVPPASTYGRRFQVVDDEIKQQAENRMKVFDAAPKSVQQQANDHGERCVEHWWNTQDQYDFDHNGNVVPVQRSQSWGDFFSVF
jgi:hypothetical protein